MPISGVLETCLYATDLEAAKQFYVNVLGLQLHSSEPNRHVFFRCGNAMFLVFNPERTASATSYVGGVAVPRHGTTGAGHAAFRISEAEFAEWRAKLIAGRVEIEAEIEWPRGGRSLYVRDPAGNSVELATAGIWGIEEGG